MRDRLGSLQGDWSVRFLSAAEKPDSPSAGGFISLYDCREVILSFWQSGHKSTGNDSFQTGECPPLSAVLAAR